MRLKRQCGALIGALVLGGCGSGTAEPIVAETDPPPTSVVGSDVPQPGPSPVLVSPAPPPGERVELAAIVGGVIVLDDGCLLLDQNANFADDVNPPDPDAVRYPVIWPAGTTWDEAAQAVVITDGVPAVVGSSVSGGGGYFSADAVATMTDDATAQRAATCAGPTGEIAVFNLGSNVVLDDTPFN